ncbi:MAG: YdeI/OmpD-associated family protein [Minicystis sp.]
MGAKKTTAKKSASKKTAKKVAVTAEAPIVSFDGPRAWSDWLATNHATSRGVWLRLAKKDAGVASITYPEAVDGALAWGWIDGQKQRGDEASWLQKFTPRGARSVWSKINRDKALALIEAGTMRPPGLAEVERARKDGRWDAAYDPPSRAVVPDDLAAAIAANARAAAFFAQLDAANRYAVLWRVHNAKKAETRQKRITQFVEMMARGEKLHP